MEVLKRSCFEEPKLDFDRFREAVKPLEQGVRNCYEQAAFNLGSDDFLEMMVYDGCFVVQLIRDIYPDGVHKLGRRIYIDILYDLLLLENQLPFSLLFELYCKIMPDGGVLDEFVRSALSLFQVRVPATRTGNENKKDIKHLLDLVHSSCSPSAQGIEQHRQFKQERPNYQQRSCKFIPSAAELEEHGIKFHGVGEDDQDHSGKFKRGTRQQEDHGINRHDNVEAGITREDGINRHDNVEADGSDDQGQLVGMFDIEFSESSKKLKIPTLPVDDDTERFFRNFMVYEQFIPSGEPTYVSDYVVLMDNLINTGKDVNLLCKTGIIDNWLGDEEAVAQMFNKLRDFINSPEDFYYAEIFDRLNRHCDRKWNKWMAALKKDYFKTPWSLVSFIAALVLLVLTLLQTIF